ncbi:hypothetical protein [Nannocystis pusilla]|uniref:hypothetical protein n=1 Tax=Nannocystis pusilla TaxID=889268 RepID=UPI003DA3C793
MSRGTCPAASQPQRQGGLLRRREGGERARSAASSTQSPARYLEGHVRAAPKGQPAEKAIVDAALARLAGPDQVWAAALVAKG